MLDVARKSWLQQLLGWVRMLWQTGCLIYCTWSFSWVIHWWQFSFGTYLSQHIAISCEFWWFLLLWNGQNVEMWSRMRVLCIRDFCTRTFFLFRVWIADKSYCLQWEQVSTKGVSTPVQNYSSRFFHLMACCFMLLGLQSRFWTPFGPWVAELFSS
jgi:hypothetical protein